MAAIHETVYPILGDSFNQFADWVAFANKIIPENVRHEKQNHQIQSFSSEYDNAL